LVSLRGLLIRLAYFLQAQIKIKSGLLEAIQSGISEVDVIKLTIKALNENPCFLFFDSVQNISDTTELNSFFELLKNECATSTVFIASRTKPTFYTQADIANKAVQEVWLGGLTESEVAEYLLKRGISLSPDNIEKFTKRSSGLPIALELLARLILEHMSETELEGIFDKTEETLISHLFSEIYEKLDRRERDLLIAASLFIFPFSHFQLFKAHAALFGVGADRLLLLKLRRQGVIRNVTDELYEVPDIVVALTAEYLDEPNDYFVRLAEHLVKLSQADPEMDTLENNLEAMFQYFRARSFDKAAQLATRVVDRGLRIHTPELARKILEGFKVDMVSPEQWQWLLCSRGSLAHASHQRKEAEEDYLSMFRLATELGDRKALSVALRCLGNVYLDRDHKRAEQYYLNSIAAAKEANDLISQVQNYNNLGSLYIHQNLFEEAFRILNKGKSLLEGITNVEGLRLSLCANFGYLFAAQQKWEDADRFIKVALEIAVKLGSKYDEGKLIYNLGWHETGKGNRNAAHDYYQEALVIGETFSLWEITELAQIALGTQCHVSEDYLGATAYFTKVAESQESRGDKTKLAITYFDIGTFYWKSNDEWHALEYYERGFHIFEHLDDTEIAPFLNNIYGICLSSAEPQRILKLLKQLKNRLKNTGSDYKLARIYGTLGRIYVRSQNRDRVALKCFHREIEILKDISDLEAQVGASIDLGLLYEERGDFAKALGVYSEAIEVAENYQLQYLLAVGHYDRGNCFAKCELLEEAEQDYQKALVIAREIGNRELETTINHNLGEAYRRQGFLGKAIEFLNFTLVLYRQRQDHENQIMTLNNLGLAYDNLDMDQDARDSFNEAIELSRKYSLKLEESNTLISLGNSHSKRNEFHKAKNAYEQALVAARAAEDIEHEEGSILSLGWVHLQLGIFEIISDEFQTIGQRAADMKHYENLLEFLKLGAQVEFSEKDFQESAKSYEQALSVLVMLGIRRSMELEKYGIDPISLPEMFNIFGRISDGVEKLIEEGSLDEARAFYESLQLCLRQSEVQRLMGDIFADMLAPIGDYLDELPHISLGQYLLSTWTD